MDHFFFSTLAEPNRLSIVELLHKKPRSVNEIVTTLQLNQPQVSKHLKVLADVGIVSVQPVAQQRIYALQPKPFKQLDTWLKKYRFLWEDRLNQFDIVLAEQTKKRKGVRKYGNK